MSHYISDCLPLVMCHSKSIIGSLSQIQEFFGRCELPVWNEDPTELEVLVPPWFKNALSMKILEV